MKALRIPYHEVLRDAEDMAKKLTQFLGIDSNVEVMTRQIDATLCRNRSQ